MESAHFDMFPVPFVTHLVFALAVDHEQFQTFLADLWLHMSTASMSLGWLFTFSQLLILLDGVHLASILRLD